MSYAVVLPVKLLAESKSRLSRHLGRDDRRRLSLAMTHDTVRAATDAIALRGPGAPAGVVVVSSDHEATTLLRRLPVLIVPDEPAAGLNAALAYGAAVAAERFPGCGAAFLMSDLPALRPTEVAAALAAATAAEVPVAYVPDHAGSGTTLLCTAPSQEPRPLFGRSSARRHRRAGAQPLLGPWPSLRADVDTWADLRHAEDLGLGAETARLVEKLRAGAVPAGGG